MIRPIVLIFIILAGAFAFTHHVAVLGSLYYYFWWFDILMHFWGGVLISLGLYSLSTFKSLNFKYTLKLLLAVLFVITFAWEIFEWQVDLHDFQTPILEAVKDMLVALAGGLLVHFGLSKYTIR